ncbi:MAG: 50S ribosomal protein L22 [Proteobacteria bacterium]|nr:50S ribosomal protein L22 [Pseudomonadota bacterium]
MGKQANPSRTGENEARVVVRLIRSSPRKLNLVAESIRGRRAGEALNVLTFSTRRIAREVKKALQSAIANAENNHQLDVDRLFVAEASVGRGTVMKRWRPRARGRVGRIKKPFSNLTVVVREREEKA